MDGAPVFKFQSQERVTSYIVVRNLRLCSTRGQVMIAQSTPISAAVTKTRE